MQKSRFAAPSGALAVHITLWMGRRAVYHVYHLCRQWWEGSGVRGKSERLLTTDWLRQNG
jgi:hypothetical protein